MFILGTILTSRPQLFLMISGRTGRIRALRAVRIVCFFLASSLCSSRIIGGTLFQASNLRAETGTRYRAPSTYTVKLSGACVWTCSRMVSVVSCNDTERSTLFLTLLPPLSRERTTHAIVNIKSERLVETRCQNQPYLEFVVVVDCSNRVTSHTFINTRTCQPSIDENAYLLIVNG